jgi:tetratricopeptide (TPR) repeat protein
MSKRNGLQESLLQAKRDNTINQFLSELNSLVKLTPQDYLVWSVKSQAHELKGQIDQAAASYDSMLRLADRPDKHTLNRLFFFAKAHGKFELMETAVRRFGSHSFNPESLTEFESLKASRLQRPTGTRVLQLKKRDEIEADRAAELNRLLAEANHEVQNGDFERAIITLRKASAVSGTSARPFYVLAVVYQRLSRIDDALQVLDKGIQIAAQDRQTLAKFLSLKAQILQSAKRWEPATEAYEALIQVQDKSAARKYSRLQLASIYRRLRRLEDAKTVVNQLVAEFPQDQIAVRMQAELGQISSHAQRIEIDQDEDDAARELEVDLQDEESVGIEYISPMLKRDIELTTFHDGRILSQGGQPNESDAFRILESAEAAAGSKVNERYPVFLEAAKAFNELPIGSYDLQYFTRALAGYAVLKGRSVVAEFRRRLIGSEVNLEDLRRLRDSATSYFLESLALQVRVDPSYVGTSIENHFRCRIAYARAVRGQSDPTEPFRVGFATLFHQSLKHDDPEIVRTAYECVVSWGSVGKRVWFTVRGFHHVGQALWQALSSPTKERAYRILGEITGNSFDPQAEPREVLKTSFLARREKISKVVEFFAELHQMAFSVQTLRELKEAWQKFPQHHYVLLETDQYIRENIKAILSVLAPFTDRSPEERTGILFTTRSNIESLLRFIEGNPTYWGRVEFEPLLRRWQTGIRSIEQRRLSEIQPKLAIEPQAFHAGGDEIIGGIVLRNDGKGTADGVKFHLEILTQNNNELIADVTEEVREEIKAKAGDVPGRLHIPVKFDADVLVYGVFDTPYKVHIRLTPIFASAELDPLEQDFTLEIKSKGSPAITSEEIPWHPYGNLTDRMFMGRDEFIKQLVDHLKSTRRNQTYVLYGLSRTGKTSILKFLKQELDLARVSVDGEIYKFIAFSWSLDAAVGETKASDMWGYFLERQVVGQMQRLANAGLIKSTDVPVLRHPGSVRFKDWEVLLEFIRMHGFYPVFLLDEFSFYREMVNKKLTDGSFLAAIRQYALGGRASFVFAGTYDLTKIVQDPTYGVRGQLVNTIDKRVSRIDRQSAIALIQVASDKLWFTLDAVEHILTLSWQIPYYIQLICRNCAEYAARNQRRILGFPEVEHVIEILVGESVDSRSSEISHLSSGAFHGSMYMPTDTPTFRALITTMCYLTKGQIRPRPVTYAEIQSVWDEHRVKFFQAKLADAITELIDREFLIPGKDEDEFAYKISVDLFRRWWAREHDNLRLELDSLKVD